MKPSLRNLVFFVAVLCFGTGLSSVRAQEGEFMENRWVAILAAYPSFASAKAEAKRLSGLSGIPFSMEGMVYDKKKGLIYPEHYEDEVYAGNYVARRYNEAEIKGKTTGFLSVERSDGYAGFRPGYYIVVAGIYQARTDATFELKRFRAWAPDAYARKTILYMGCMH